MSFFSSGFSYFHGEAGASRSSLPLQDGNNGLNFGPEDRSIGLVGPGSIECITTLFLAFLDEDNARRSASR